MKNVFRPQRDWFTLEDGNASVGLNWHDKCVNNAKVAGRCSYPSMHGFHSQHTQQSGTKNRFSGFWWRGVERPLMNSTGKQAPRRGRVNFVWSIKGLIFIAWLVLSLFRSLRKLAGRFRCLFDCKTKRRRRARVIGGKEQSRPTPINSLRSGISRNEEDELIKSWLLVTA